MVPSCIAVLLLPKPAEEPSEQPIKIMALLPWIYFWIYLIQKVMVKDKG